MIKMTKDGGVKIVDREEVKAELEADGWVEVKEKSRKAKEEE